MRRLDCPFTSRNAVEARRIELPYGLTGHLHCRYGQSKFTGKITNRDFMAVKMTGVLR